MKKLKCPFKHNELVVWAGDNEDDFYQNEVVLFMGEVVQMPDHCVVAKDNGRVLFGYHTDNFRKAEEDEI